MQVKTHSGLEDLNESKVNEVIMQACQGFDKVDWSEIAVRSKISWYDGITTDELAEATIMAATSLIEKHPQYDYVAARLLLRKISKEVRTTFNDYVQQGIDSERLAFEMGQRDWSNTPGKFNLKELKIALIQDRDNLFKYQGVKILYDRYLLRDKEGNLLETPQYFFMRVAMGIALGEKENHTEWAIKFYDLISTFKYMPSTPTLFNSGTTHPQMASCYVTHVDDSLTDIFKMYGEMAQMSKWAGGIGTNWTSVRGSGSHINGTNGKGTGLIPWLKIQNDIAVAVNQGGKRQGSHCAYLEPWHVDFVDFLELRKGIGDDRRRTHDLDTAAWVPDIFMQRVKEDGVWSFFDPAECPNLTNSWGEIFTEYYEKYEEDFKFKKQMPAKDLWKKMLNALFETGHPWITFKDACNRANPMKSIGMIKSSNLCTEITLNTSPGEEAVCNLGSINLSVHIKNKFLDLYALEDTTKLAVRMLDNIIDGMFYPTEDSAKTNKANRPIGLGMMGWHDYLLQTGSLFDSGPAKNAAKVVSSRILKAAKEASEQLAKERGVFPNAPYSEVPTQRNSHLTAIAPTATISNITGCSPCIEPYYSNLFVKSNLSGDFTVLNAYLVEDLEAIGLWPNEEILNKIKFHNGSIAQIDEIPDNLKKKYRTVFEYEQKVLVDLAVARQPYITQAQSLNLYVDKPSGQGLSDLYMYAWGQGLKTTYYLRTKAASGIEKSTIDPNVYGKTHMTAIVQQCKIDDPGCSACE